MTQNYSIVKWIPSKIRKMDYFQIRINSWEIIVKIESQFGKWESSDIKWDILQIWCKKQN